MMPLKYKNTDVTFQGRKPNSRTNFQSYPGRETAAKGEKDADDIRKVIRKSFIQWF